MKSKLILFLALAMGAVTTVLFYQYMQDAGAQEGRQVPQESVVVAETEIQANQRITSNDLAVKSFPEDHIHTQAIGSIEQATGSYATATIAKGEPVLTHRIQDEQNEQLFVSRKVRDGYRAVSTGVNFVQSVSNLIEPEDRVDVIFTERVGRGEQEEVRSERLLQNVRVLAVGRKMVESRSKEAYVEYSSVTLELVPTDTVALVRASEKGSIQLVLHSRVIPPNEEGDGNADAVE